MNPLRYATRLGLTLAVLGLSAFAAIPARADGGHLQMRQVSGPFTISLFTTPEELGIGPADMSVLVEDNATGKVILDSEVFITLTPADGSDTTVVGRLTHANATNKLMQAGIVRLPRAGTWRAVVDIREHGQQASAGTSFLVTDHYARRDTLWEFAAFPLLAIGLFAIVQNGKSRIHGPRAAVAS